MSTATRGTVPSTRSTVVTLAAVTLKRLGRGKALWIGVLIAALPILYAIGVRGQDVTPSPDDVVRLVLALLPAMFISASIGEEIEDRTTTYLWSRPIARWAVLAGKLCALTPIVMALIVGGWYAAIDTWHGTPPPLLGCVALAAACIATSLVAAGIAVLVPKHGMALTIGYMLIDVFIGAMPFSLNNLSITHQAHALANLATQVDGRSEIAAPVIALAVIAALWSVVGFMKIRRLEA